VFGYEGSTSRRTVRAPLQDDVRRWLRSTPRLDISLYCVGGGLCLNWILRDVDAVTRGFSRIAKELGFPGLRLHNLRGSHETILLDRGVPEHVVGARCGHDPAVLLKSYAKGTKKADATAAEVIGALSKSALGSKLGPK
jgi:integrase